MAYCTSESRHHHLLLFFLKLVSMSLSRSMEIIVKSTISVWAEPRLGAFFTYHRRLDEAPGVAARHVGLEDAGRAPGLVHAAEHVDLPAAHRGGRRVHRLGQRGHRLPLVGDGVVPGAATINIYILKMDEFQLKREKKSNKEGKLNAGGSNFTPLPLKRSSLEMTSILMIHKLFSQTHTHTHT